VQGKSFKALRREIFSSTARPYGVSYGLVMIVVFSVIFLLQHGFPDGLWIGVTAGLGAGLLGGLLFGGFMALALGWSHARSVKRLPYGVPEEAVGVVEHVRSIELPVAYAQTLALCRDAIGIIKKAKILEEDHALGIIEAKVGMTWESFGESVMFRMHRVDDLRTHIEISSRPTKRGTLVDYGKNLDNVEKLLGFFRRHNAVGQE